MPSRLSLNAYLALAPKRAAAAPGGPRPDRPEGELVWIHLPSAGPRAAADHLARQIVSQRARLSVLFTTPPDLPDPGFADAGWFHEQLGPDTAAATDAFLSHWTPDLCLWLEGHFRAATLTCAARSGVPLYLIDAREDAIHTPGPRWLPGLTRATLELFTAAFARSANAARTLRKLGVEDSDIAITGSLQEGTAALPCIEEDREALAGALAGRQVWLAAMACADEIEAISRAHRVASRTAHLLLLVLVPAREEDGPALHEALRREGWRVCLWSAGHWPDEATQILIADSHDEMGLWFRVAPVAFMASSLTPGHGGCDPYEPAALGSAILYGPNVSRHLDAYARLSQAGGARMVRDPGALASAVKRLIAPDEAAAMAYAAWQVASEGAEVTDRVIDLVLDTLDLAGAA